MVEFKEPILVWGAGAIGGAMGASWIRSGHDVVFVDVAADHVGAINNTGLKIEGSVFNDVVRARACVPTALEGKFDIVVLAVKAQHTAQAIRSIEPHLSKSGVVISCQNGMNELEIAKVIGAERTIGAFLNFTADWIGPGHINYAGRGSVVIGEIDGSSTPRIEHLHRLFREFDEDAILTANIFGYLWSKLAYGAVLSAAAVTNETTADFLASPEMRPLITVLSREVLNTALAEGAEPQPFQGFDPAPFIKNDPTEIEACISNILSRRKGTAKPRSGFWRDLAVRKRPTEVPQHLGPVCEAAHRHGLSIETVAHLIAQVRRIETGQAVNDIALAREMLATAIASIAKSSIHPPDSGLTAFV